MNKELRQVEALADLLDEFAQISKNIEALPVGYISVKQISGHTYYYRQWREGNKIISDYVPEAKLPGIRRKIAVRKENEAHLKEVKKDLAKLTRQLAKAEVLNEQDVEELKQAALNGEDVYELAQAKVGA